MIVDLPQTTVSEISKRMVQLRREGGATTLGRVLTLVIVATDDSVEQAISAANVASREHPMRIIALAYGSGAAPGDRDPSEAGPDRDRRGGLDGQIRVGADAGAGDVIVLSPRGEAGAAPDQLLSGLLLADAPVVVWWSCTPPKLASSTPLGRLAQRRIIDSGGPGDPSARLLAVAESYLPGDTDLAWSRLTFWRAQLAAALDNTPGIAVESVTVSGTPRSSSTMLLAAWLRLQLGVPVRRVDLPHDSGVEWGIHSVALHTASGDIAITRTHGVFASVTQPDRPSLEVPLPRRADPECLVEDLRVLHPDTLYGRVVTEGLPLLLAERAGSEESPDPATTGAER